VNSAVFGAITAATLSIAAALAGCFAASQIVLRPMLEADGATLARNNCYPWNAGATPRVTTSPLGYRREPGSFSAENNSGARWSSHTNFEGALVRLETDREQSRRGAPIHIYGDSFAAGAEVDYDDGWYAQLGEVANFGIYGGAPDQGLLYLKRNLADGWRPKIVILEMIPENVGRLWNIYHCLLYPQSPSSAAVKPHFEMEPDIRLMPAPTTLENWTEAVMMHDFWARRALLIERMQRSNDLSLTYHFLVNRTIIADPYTHLLQSSNTSTLLNHIIKDFAGLARKHDFIGYFLLLPGAGKEINDYAAGGRHRTFAELLAALSSANGITFLDGYQFAAESFSGNAADRFSVIPNIGHMSKEANAVIGRAVNMTIRHDPEQQ
jgi:hypothetical protein